MIVIADRRSADGHKHVTIGAMGYHLYDRGRIVLCDAQINRDTALTSDTCAECRWI